MKMARRGLDMRMERREESLLYDTRRGSEKFSDFMLSPEMASGFMIVLGAVSFLFYKVTDLVALFGCLMAWYLVRIQNKAGLPLRMPRSSGEMDPKELDPATLKPMKAKGTYYLGVDDNTGEEVWISDVMARTHMLFMGTTGSGKTEYLLSTVFNALVQNSGFIYVDGKADNSLYGKIWSMARSVGREEDVVVINFQTGARDIYESDPQPTKLSNTLNPFSNGSSGMLNELVKGLIQTGEKSTWTQQTEAFVEALIKPLVYLRDFHGFPLDVEVIRDHFLLDRLEELAWESESKYPGLEASGTLAGLRAYLQNKPGYKKENMYNHGEGTNEQHNFITMQLIRAFSSLADTYGYIMKTQLAEIDFNDVFVNRRILVVLLPALEKSPTELTNLGRIVVAAIKATMAKGLGSSIEGSWKKIIDSKPTNSATCFPAVLDEYGYYAVEGFAVVPAQARSIGFSAIFAGQDLPTFEKASKEEAKATLGNTNTKCVGKLECVDTYQYFKSLTGTGLYTKLNRYAFDDKSLATESFKADDNVSVERIDRVTIQDLKKQISGQWHIMHGDAVLKVTSFFANPSKVKDLRVNHFIPIARPSKEELESFKRHRENFKKVLDANLGAKQVFDGGGQIQDFNSVRVAHDSLDEVKDPFERAAMSLSLYCLESLARAAAFSKINASAFDDEATPITDFVSRITNGGRDLGSNDMVPVMAEQDDASSLLSALLEEPQQMTAQSTTSSFFAPPVDMERESSGLHEFMDDFASSTDVFAADIEPPVAVSLANNDVPESERQIPSEEQDWAQLEFDPPASSGGLLNRDITEAGLAGIERILGARDDESSRSAAIVVSDIGDSTRYPAMPPRDLPDIDQFTHTAAMITELLDHHLDFEDEPLNER
ncbi:MAG: hypothetical protein O9327_15020 [Polaromonas sp.]|nr:hypothetical protein [Polaromonas sp.]